MVFRAYVVWVGSTHGTLGIGRDLGMVQVEVGLAAFVEKYGSVEERTYLPFAMNHI